ncbi:MAG: Smr/MutS family protein [Halioglobus sp.]|nr:Smr/MutS family protein [Halioglobus sp.]
MSNEETDNPQTCDEDDEASLFRSAVAGTRPLRGSFAEPERKPPSPRARFRRRDERAALNESLHGNVDDIETGAGERLQFRRPEVGQRTLRRLARGSFSVQAEIDLHGMTAVQAETALKNFIERSLLDDLRCIRVVHGKGLGSGHGGPVLKAKVNAWLRRWRDVLAFASARQVDGGTGAVYVLLRGR